jgi:hypothetical protein
MADYNSLKATIDANIRANGVQAITGPVLNACLKAMITVLGNGYQLQGSIAQPGDDPSVPDARVAYVASGPGTYTDFGGLVVPDDGHAYMLTWDTQWTAVQLPVPTSAALAALATVVAGKQDILTFDPSPVSGSLNPVTSGGIFSAIESAKGAAGLAEALLDTDSEGAEQEFSLRKSGGDGGAYFRRLLGNTKAFNQLIRGFASWTATNGTIAQADGVLTYTVTNATGLTTQYAGDMANINIIAGHKYFMTIGVKLAHTGRVYLGGSGWGGGASWGLQNYTTANAWQFYSRIVDAVSTASGVNAYCSLYEYTDGASIAVNDTMQITAPMLIDLTLMFGAGNEPTTPEEFREKYPLLYYAYGRKLIHNKVAKVITKGANQWDEVWEVGNLSTTTGEEVPDNGNIRSKDFIPVLPNTEYYFKAPSINPLRVWWYDANKNPISYSVKNNTTGISPANAAFVRFGTANLYGRTYGNNICISLSDAEINGQYFPYWERELALDITNQEDTDGNKPFAEGVKSCPVASDEFNEVGGIVRVGVRPYQASDDTDASVITDGVDTAYALTTPVPFTWKEPLNTGIKVSKYGTEEITPAQTENIDTAPFRAVTTYSISVANLVAALAALGNRGGAKGSLGSGNQEENPENEELTPEEESPKEEAPKEEETPVVEPTPEVQSKR